MKAFVGAQSVQTSTVTKGVKERIEIHSTGIVSHTKVWMFR